MTEWIKDFMTKGFAQFREPELASLVDVDGFQMVHTEEMLRDNFKEDLPENIANQLHLVSLMLKMKYIDPVFPKNEFIKYILWEGVDADSAAWHTDGFEGMNVFFLMYFDNMKEETGGAVHFKYGDNVETFYPQHGDLFMLNQSPGFFHRAEKATIRRRQASFDFLVDDL